MEFADSVVEVTGLTKTYNLYKKPADRVKEIFSLTKKEYSTKYYALNNVSFSVKRGETLGIIGKNGAGKSTLLKILTGVTTPSSGKVIVKGDVAALLELGTGFNPEYNGYENIYLNGSMRGYSRTEMGAKIDEIVSFADIGDYMSQPIKTYSSGMLARLAFAVMVCFKPDVLIVDEALSVGDVFFQQKCNNHMKNEMKGVTKILVTHDMNSIANMADRVILLERGKIIQEGQPLAVIQNYLKIMHTEVFSDAPVQKLEERDPHEEKENTIYVSTDADCAEGWHNVTMSDVGGAGEIIITKCRLLINDEVGDIAKPDDNISIELKIHSMTNAENIICGYTFKDKYGNSIFAQNTLGAGIMVKDIKTNKDYLIRYSFRWPEIKEGDYFVTLGIGEGIDQMVHKIQCWAHNIIHVNAIALKPMHGIINHEMKDFTCKEV